MATGPDRPIGGTGASPTELSAKELNKHRSIKEFPGGEAQGRWVSETAEASMATLRDWFRLKAEDPLALHGLTDEVKFSDFHKNTVFGAWFFVRNEVDSGSYDNREDAAIAFHQFPYYSGGFGNENSGLDSNYSFNLTGPAAGSSPLAPACDSTVVMNSSWGATAEQYAPSAVKAVFNSTVLTNGQGTQVTVTANAAGNPGNDITLTGIAGTKSYTGASRTAADVTVKVILDPSENGANKWVPGYFQGSITMDPEGAQTVRLEFTSYNRISGKTITGDGIKDLATLISDHNNAGANATYQIELVTGDGSHVPENGQAMVLAGGSSSVTVSRTFGFVIEDTGAAHNGETITGDPGKQGEVNLSLAEQVIAAGWSIEEPLASGTALTETDILEDGHTITMNGGTNGPTITSLATTWNSTAAANKDINLGTIVGGSVALANGETLTLVGGLNVGDVIPGTGGEAYGTFGRSDSYGHSAWDGTLVGNGVEYTLTVTADITTAEFEVLMTPGIGAGSTFPLKGPDGVASPTVRYFKWGTPPSSTGSGGLNSSWSWNALVYCGEPPDSGNYDEYGISYSGQASTTPSIHYQTY